MDNYTTKLSDIASKPKKNKGAINDAVLIIAKAFSENKDYEFTVHWLMKFHYSACEKFFSNYKATNEDAEKIVDAFIKNEDFNNNTNQVAFNRGLLVCGAFFNMNIDSSITAKLAYRVITLGDKDGGFSGKLIESFKKYIIDRGQLDKFIALKDTLKKDSQRNMFDRFLAEFKEPQNQPSDKAVKPVQNKAAIQKNEPVNPTDKSKNKNNTQFTPECKGNNTVTEQQYVIDELNKTVRALAEQVKILSNINNTVSTLKTAIAEKEDEIKRLNEKLETSQCNYAALNMEKTDLEEQLSRSQAKINDLNERLKTVFQMDSIAQNQELEALKKKVSDSLKVEYEEFLSSAAEFNEDNFQANYASLQRIFKILKRFDFSLE